MRHLRLLHVVVLLGAAVLAGAPAAVGAVDLQSHRAVYRMVLANAQRSSEVVSANGVMVYRFARGCDGWTVENRTFLRLLYENNVEADTLWSFASWESLDGLRFRFHARYEQDGRSLEKLEGEAVLEGREAGGTARFTQPPEKVIVLPPGTAFPTQHVRQMIAAAERGETTLSRVVFDGASLDNPYAVNAVFGRLGEEAADALAKSAGLPVAPSWWTRMAFFPVGGREEEPEFEMGAHYRADGIADQILQTFDRFSLEVRLRELELLPAPEC